jgi:hypothetical protein
MRALTLAFAISLLSIQTVAQSLSSPARPNFPPGAVVLPIRRLVLYSNGVAYVERRGTITGRTEIALPFRQSQVDDVLKSLMVLDLGGGRIQTVTYNSSAPLSSRLAEIPFSIEPWSRDSDDALAGGLVSILSQLQGSRVAATTPSRSVAGAILTVEERESEKLDGKVPTLAQSLVIATGGGELVNIDLREVRSIRLLDEGARGNISRFSEASAEASRRDSKTIIISCDGVGTREVVVSYVVAAPIWKTSYRVALDERGTPFFQGWTIVDNVGDEDWQDVQLSLVSGTPVSFIQPLQQPLYRHRPVLPLSEDLQLSPQVYEAEVTAGSPGGVPGGVAGGVLGAAPQGLARLNAGGLPAEPPPPPPAGPTTTLSDLFSSGESGVKPAATGAEIGDLFEYRIDHPVTLGRERSAMIPILQTRMEGERVSLYNEAAHRDRPMSGVRLKNTSPLTLEGGPLTVIEGDAYAGEAIIERLKPGEERFISFALDLSTRVTTRSETDRATAFFVRIAKGVLQAHYYRSETKTYTITNQTDRQRVVYIEHPIREGWVLARGTAALAGTTASFYRFRVETGPRATVSLPVTERLALMDSYTVSNLTIADLELFVSGRLLDESTRAALQQIVAIKDRIGTLEAQLSATKHEESAIAADQARLRENIKALKETSHGRLLIARYITKAGEQEARLEQIVSERKQAEAERARLQVELDAVISALALEHALGTDR